MGGAWRPETRRVTRLGPGERPRALRAARGAGCALAIGLAAAVTLWAVPRVRPPAPRMAVAAGADGQMSHVSLPAGDHVYLNAALRAAARATADAHRAGRAAARSTAGYQGWRDRLQAEKDLYNAQQALASAYAAADRLPQVPAGLVAATRAVSAAEATL